MSEKATAVWEILVAFLEMLWALVMLVLKILIFVTVFLVSFLAVTSIYGWVILHVALAVQTFVYPFAWDIPLNWQAYIATGLVISMYNVFVGVRRLSSSKAK